MPTLTRRRDPTRQETWLIYYGDVHAGTIAQSVGNPGATPQWQWRCGFYPGSRPGECTAGTAASFEQVRATFEAAWRIFLAKRTDADFREWREQQARTDWKYRMWETGCKLPTQMPDGRSQCFCGEWIDSAGTSAHIYATHMQPRRRGGREISDLSDLGSET
jgi:hypothetical protein